MASVIAFGAWKLHEDPASTVIAAVFLVVFIGAIAGWALWSRRNP